MALTTARSIPRRGSYYFESDAPMSNTKIWQGALCALNAAGFLVKGAEAATLRNPCVIDHDNGQLSVDNSAGSNGSISARVFFGVFPFKSGTSADALTQADVGKVVYIMDDETVGKTDNTGARSPAGKLDRIDADGYWVSLARP
jgi:hypothetical protein